MKKKLIAYITSVALLIIAVVGATYSYFSNSEKADNVFTVGNVDIVLMESTLHREGQLDGDSANDGTPIADSAIEENSATYEKWLEEQELLPGVKINKMPYVKNVGSSDAYVRIRVMIPSLLDLDCSNDYHCPEALAEEFTLEGDWQTPETVTENGIEYDVYTFVRTEPLKSHEMTYWNVWNTVGMDTSTDSEDLEDLIAKGVIDENGKLSVLVQADAIQAASFKNATEAFAAFDAEQK